MHKLAATARHCSRFALDIRFLHITLKSLPWGSIKTLAYLLSAARNITDLRLDIPNASYWRTILHRVRFRKLILFATNIPHAILRDFLNHHSYIRHLQLGPCGGTGSRMHKCPVVDIHFHHLQDLACSPTCIKLQNTPYISRLQVTYQRNQETLRAPISISLAGGMACAALTVLHMDFDPTDRGLLLSIANGAPLITALKLSEVHGSDSVSALCVSDDSKC